MQAAEVLTRFVRIQLVIFTIASVVGVAVMALKYVQVQSFLGIGRLNVTLELPASGGLYRFSNVTYRGVQVGKVTAVGLRRGGMRATMSLDTSSRIPADLDVKVRSVSAVGEQYVDLEPHSDSPPYLTDGAVVRAGESALPQPVGPMLDQTSALIGSIPKDQLRALLDEMHDAFAGAQYDLQSLMDSSAQFTADVNPVGDRLRTLLQDSAPLLDTQDQSSDAISVWTRSLAGVTDQLVTNDPQVRTLLQKGPGVAQDVAGLLDQLKPTVPILLANLTTVSQLAVTYHPALEQILVLLPPAIANLQAIQPNRNASGLGLGSFRISISDPPACTVGFLPPSSWRSTVETDVIDTPDDLYCKLPQDSPVAVRGMRNIPCMTKPGKRAPTAEICNSDQEYQPLADRQPVLGPYPRDPGLEAQGVPPDSRWFPDQGLYAPPGQGPPAPTSSVPPPPTTDEPPPVRTNVPPQGNSGQVPPIAGPPAPPGDPLPPPNEPQPWPGFPPPPAAPQVPPPPPDADSPVPAAPSSFATQGSSPTPSVQAARYDPDTGQYVAPDGRLYRQSDLARQSVHRTWKDLVLTS
jgi:phospholipid/cholesterol/gamma-HCH transport system substrate-binding protein